MKIIKSISYKRIKVYAIINVPMKSVLVMSFLCVINGGFGARPIDIIDHAHLKDYPYCGSMHYESKVHPREASGRSVNTKDSKNYYRWLAFLIRHNLQADGSYRNSRCTGSIITER